MSLLSRSTLTTLGFRHAAVPVQERRIREMARSSAKFTIISTTDSPDFPAAEHKATVGSRNARFPREGAPDNRLDLQKGGGRFGGPPGPFIPGATPAQQAALTATNAALMPKIQAVNEARNALGTATFLEKKDDAVSRLAFDRLSAAELALANERANQITTLQQSAARLNADQTRSLVQSAVGGRGGPPPNAGGRGGDPIQEKVAAILSKYLSPEALKNYDAVALLSTTGELPIPDKDAFFKWVSDGHGFIALHSAADTLHQAPEYIKMLGGEFAGHGAHSEVAVVNLDPQSPLTAGWGNAIKITGEFHTFKNYEPSRVHVLLGMETHPTSGTPGHFPVSWIKPYGAGRVFHTSLGHRDDVLDPNADIGDQEFKVRYNQAPVAQAVQKHILSGILWSLGLTEANSTPGPR